MRMSLRHAIHKLLSHGRFLFPTWRGVGALKIHARSYGSGPAATQRPALQTHYENARKIFANSILSRVTTKVSSNLREKTTRQLLTGNSRPFFAFVGIGLASGSVLKKEDQLEGLCWEIRESLDRMQKSTAEAESDIFPQNEPVTVSKLDIGPFIGKGSNAAIFAAKKADPNEEEKYPFALKMVFNFGIESTASAIMARTFREMVPARIRYLPSETMENLEIMQLPPHPNLVAMHLAFPDRVPDNLPGTSEFLNALPSRLSSSGYGRNMSLFILMKRYEMNLSQYLAYEKPDVREAVLIFAQILEAVAHINRHGVAHRDLKSDNFLVDTVEDRCPQVVLSDFGCCLADAENGLFLPLASQWVDRGGNVALMAPEVATAQPATGLLTRLKYIDYTKSDGWSAGAVAYEIFNGCNPFCEGLRNTTYSEADLPQLQAPLIVAKVVKSLLLKNPSKRISADFAADVIQLHLWAPSDWLKNLKIPSNSEIMQWLLCMTTKILTTASFGHRRSEAEYLLIGSFLRRACLSRLRDAIAFAQDI